MVIIVCYMCSIIRIFLITVMVVLLYVCSYHVYFLYFNIHRLYIIFLSIYQVKCGFHPTRKRVGFSQQIYSERNITLIDYLDFSKKIKTQIMITYFSSMKILKMQVKKSIIIYLMQIGSLMTS